MFSPLTLFHVLSNLQKFVEITHSLIDPLTILFIEFSLYFYVFFISVGSENGLEIKKYSACYAKLKTLSQFKHYPTYKRLHHVYKFVGMCCRSSSTVQKTRRLEIDLP